MEVRTYFVLRRVLSFLLLVLLLLVLAGEVAFLYWRDRQPVENRFDPIIASVAAETGADPFLIRALVWRESKFDPLTHGSADERGLMQVTPLVGQMWAKANKVASFQADQLYDPETNIRVGTWYLNWSLRHWSQTDDPVAFALAEYNAGRSNALKWVDPTQPLDHYTFLQRISFPNTRKYVDIIMTKRDQYRKDFGQNRWYRDYALAHPVPAAVP